MFNTLYKLTDDSIVYQLPNKPGIKILFKDFLLVCETIPGLYRSGTMYTLLEHPQFHLHFAYHLAAILEKFDPDVWDWENLFYHKEWELYEKTAGEEAYLKAKYTHRPEFFDDYAYEDYLLRIKNWAKEKGLYKSNDEIREQTKRKIQELVIARSKTDFIKLTEKHIKLIKRK
jgi:hypothetical protein